MLRGWNEGDVSRAKGVKEQAKLAWLPNAIVVCHNLLHNIELCRCPYDSNPSRTHFARQNSHYVVPNQWFRTGNRPKGSVLDAWSDKLRRHCPGSSRDFQVEKTDCVGLAHLLFVLMLCHHVCSVHLVVAVHAETLRCCQWEDSPVPRACAGYSPHDQDDICGPLHVLDDLVGRQVLAVAAVSTAVGRPAFKV